MNSREVDVSVFGCSLFKTEQFRADPTAESGVARQGVLPRRRKFFWAYDRSIFNMTREHLAEDGGSKVDYVALVNNRTL
jgi:hypothetical protein